VEWLKEFKPQYCKKKKKKKKKVSKIKSHDSGKDAISERGCALSRKGSGQLLKPLYT
jgi:hypothetical protein